MKFIPRDHIVTFRLTKREYESLKSMCDESASSISDAARNAVLALAPPAGTAESVEIKLNSFDDKLNQIISLLDGLKQNVSAEGAPPSGGTGAGAGKE